jgi:hypothetical protein
MRDCTVKQTSACPNTHMERNVPKHSNGQMSSREKFPKQVSLQRGRKAHLERVLKHSKQRSSEVKGGISQTGAIAPACAPERYLWREEFLNHAQVSSRETISLFSAAAQHTGSETQPRRLRAQHERNAQVRMTAQIEQRATGFRARHHLGNLDSGPSRVWCVWWL